MYTHIFVRVCMYTQTHIFINSLCNRHTYIHIYTFLKQELMEEAVEGQLLYK